MSGYVSGDMVRGHIDSIILNSLLDSDKDTSMIREEIEKRASGKFQLKQGTFYSALQRIVKNGLVIEYRTTGSDGVRRKFFQLTEKGKAHIEKNQNNWTVSQEVINTLLDSEGPQVTFHKPSDYVRPEKPIAQQEEKIPEFVNEEPEEEKIPKFDEVYDENDKLALDAASDYKASDLEDQNETQAEQLVMDIENNSNLNNDEFEAPPTTFDDILDMLTKAEEKEYAAQNTYDEYGYTDNFGDDKAEINENITESTVNETTAVELESTDKDKNDNEQLSDEEIRIKAAEKRAREAEEERIKAEKEEAERKKAAEEARIREAERIAREKEIAEIRAEEEAKKRLEAEKIEVENNSTVTETDFANGTVKVEGNLIHPQFGGFEHVADYSENTSSQKIDKNDDDFLNGDDLPAQKEYRNILNRIFCNEVSPVEPTKKSENQENIEPVSDVIVDNLDFSSMRRHDPAKDLFADEEQAAQKARKQNSKDLPVEKNKRALGAYDYSDIVKLSEDEGFKISTADNTNKNELGKILVNKLNFHTALIFLAVVAIETLVVGLSMESTAQLGVGAYFIFLGIIALLPATFGVIYYLTPNRVANEVGSFKGSFETALIITLNLILLIIAFAIVTNLDFSSATHLSRGIFIPIMVSINAPIFVIIRYSLLENQAYFS